MKGFLGCDIGTTGTKTMLFDENNNVLGRGYQGYGLFTPFEGAYEQNPEDWYSSLKQSIKEAVKNTDVEIKALSLSAQGGSFFLADVVDEKIVPLTNALTWMDARAGAEYLELVDEISPDEVYDIVGWKLGKGSAIARLRWLKKHDSANFDKAKLVLSTSDYVYYKLTGKSVIDYSSAAMMGMFSVKGLKYDSHLVELAKITQDKLPKLVATGEYLGEILPDVAKDLGLSEGVKVYAGAHDQYAASLGSNYFSKNDLLISTGTTWVIFGNSETPVFNQHYLSSGVHPRGNYGVIKSAVSSGTVMEWTKKLIGEEFSVIDKEAAARPVDKGLMVYPFISGGGGWHGKGELNYSVKGAKMMHDKFDLARATMEGVAFEIKYLIDLYRKSGVIDDKIIVAGGAARSEIWMQILASVLDKEVYISNQADRCCFGAFSIAKKEYTQQDFVKFEFDGRVVKPDKSVVEIYKEKYENYNKNLN